MSVQTREDFTFEIDGTEYRSDRPHLTIPEILSLASLPAGTALVEILADGIQRNVAADERVDLEDARHFKRRPKFKRGGPPPRMHGERSLIAQHFPAIELGPEGEWLIIHGWPLPAGWTVPHTDLLIIIPPGYPATSPDSFYVGNEVALAGGREPTNSSANQQVLQRAWRFFSWHIDDQWHPQPDSRRGDNLLTYILACGTRMAEVN